MNIKDRIMEIFNKEPGKTQYFSDLADKLNLPVEDVVNHCFELAVEGRIKMSQVDEK